MSPASGSKKLQPKSAQGFAPRVQLVLKPTIQPRLKGALSHGGSDAIISTESIAISITQGGPGGIARVPHM